MLPLGVMALHMLGSNTFARRLRWYDALPFAYVMFVILSQAVVGASALRSFHFYISLVYGGILVSVPLYYFCAFGPWVSLSAGRVSAALLSSSSIVGAMAIAEHYTSWNLWGQHYGDHPPRVVSTLAQPAVLGAFLGVGVVVATAVLVWGWTTETSEAKPGDSGGNASGSLFHVHARPDPRNLRGGAAPDRRPAADAPRRRWCRRRSGSSDRAELGPNLELSVYRTRGPGETVNVRTRLVLVPSVSSPCRQRPILGWGYGQFDTVKNSESFNTGTLPSKQLYDYTSHDTYLTILVELGAVGLALFLLPLISFAVMTLRALRWTTTSKWFSLALLGSWASSL